jgi:hypothetical protein
MSEPLLPSRFDVEPALAGVIGWSELGVPLHVHYVGRAAAPLRVLMLAGQHGDEGRARAAVGQFLDAGAASKKLESMSLAVLPNLNPDGTLVKSRANANELDLNRDHLLLDSAETQALHRFVRVWRPHLVIDVHTYPSRRRYLLAHNLTHCHDVFLDVPTNPAAACVGATEILHALLTRLNRRGYLADRYVRPTNSGRVRHSTADVLDVRNSLAIRYGIPTLLVEGRQPLRSDGAAERTGLKAALIAALEIALQCAEEYQQALRAPPAVPAGSGRRNRYSLSLHPWR